MDIPETSVAWLADATVHDLIQRFPLPIALLDDAGGVLVLNDLFSRTYGSEVLYLPSLQDLIRKPTPGWKTIQIPGRGRGSIEVKAQMLRVQANQMLILDDAAYPDLLQKLDELYEQITKLEKLSATDLLTGAWNRAHFDRVVALEMDRSARFEQPVSLVFFDIDHFKQVNDTYGHQAGDRVLCELVKLIRAANRSIDSLFRWGGEEFMMLASSTGYRAGATLAEKLRSSVEQHRFTGVGSVTISLGVAEHIATESAETWFRRVDEVLYRAKDGGRNQVCVDRRGSSDMWAADRGLCVLRLVWQEAYECDEPTIDRQHREIFELANALFDVSFTSESPTEAFGAALEKLMVHIARHFIDEEALLVQHGYKNIELHRAEHAGLLARAMELKASTLAGKTSLGELVEFLAKTVVADHIFKDDWDYFPLFKKQTA